MRVNMKLIKERVVTSKQLKETSASDSGLAPYEEVMNEAEAYIKAHWFPKGASVDVEESLRGGEGIVEMTVEYTDEQGDEIRSYFKVYYAGYKESASEGVGAAIDYWDDCAEVENYINGVSDSDLSNVDYDW
jgi:hypothetical protein